MDSEVTEQGSDSTDEIHYMEALLNNLKSAELAMPTKTIFKLYALLFQSSRPEKLIVLKKIGYFFGIFVKQLQLLFLVARARVYPSSQIFDAGIEGALAPVMIDYYTVSSGNQIIFSNFLLALTFFTVFSLCLVLIQLITKKKILRAHLLCLINITTWVLLNIMLFPMLIFSMLSIKYLGSTSTYLAYYDATLHSSSLLGLVFILELFLVIFHLFLCTMFHYESQYTSNSLQSRAYSSVLLKQLLYFIIVSLAFTIAPANLFLAIGALAGLHMLKEFLYFQPYYSFWENYFEAGTWVIFATSCVAILIDNLFNLHSPILSCLAAVTPLEYILLYVHMQNYFEKQCESRERSPYLLEIRVRKLLQKEHSVTAETIEVVDEIFREATKEFLDFKPMLIWECNYVMQSSSNYALAIIKLLKMNFSQRRDLSTQSNHNAISYPFNLESEYFLYLIYKKIIKVKSFKEIAFFQYLEDLNIFAVADYNLCIKLLDAINSTYVKKSSSSKISVKQFKEYYNAFLQKKNIYKINKRKYGKQAEFISKHKNFHKELSLNPGSRIVATDNIIEENFVDKFLGNISSTRSSILLVSGHPDSLGKILFANNEAAEMLLYPSKSEIVGKNITKLIPEPFDKIHNEILIKTLLFTNNLISRRPIIYMKDYYGNSMELSIVTRIVFYSRIPYFIIELIGHEFCLSFALCSPSLTVYTCSSDVKDLFPHFEHSIEDVFPNLQAYILSTPPDCDFVYEDNGRTAQMKWTELIIGTERLISIYFLDAYMLYEFQPPQLEVDFTQSTIFHNIYTTQLVAASQRRRNSKLVIPSKILSVLVIRDNSNAINRYSKMLNFAAVGATALVLGIYISMIITTMYFVNGSSIDNMIADVLSMRYNVASLTYRMRTLDLYYQGVPCYFSESDYKKVINTNLINLQNTLVNINNYDSKFQIKTLFQDTAVVIWDFEKGNSTSQEQNLYQAVTLLIAHSTQVLNSSFTDKDSLLFVHRNSFLTIYKALNDTGFMCLNSAKKNSLSILSAINSMNLISFIPYIALIIFSIFMLTKLEDINNNQWSIINSISDDTKSALKNLIVARIKKYYIPNFDMQITESKGTELRLSIYKKPLASILVLLLISLIFYAIALIAILDPLQSSINSRLDNIFYGGKRSFFISSFAWAKESYAKDLNISYLDIFEKNYDIASIPGRVKELTDDISYFENLRFISVSKSMSSNLYYADYTDFLLYNPCNYITTLKNCSNTFISKGIHQGIVSFVEELYYYINYSHRDKKDLLFLEHITSQFEVSLGVGLALYSSATDVKTAYYKSSLIITIAVFSISLLLYLIVVRFILSSVKAELLGKNELISMFKEGTSNINTEKSIQASFAA